MAHVMDFITNRIAIGGHKSVTNLDYLRRNGISGVLNCAINLDVTWTRGGKFPIEYQKVGMNDSDQNYYCMLAAAVVVLEQLLERHEKVLVNCRAGASRSVTVTALYLLKTGQKDTFEDAVNFIRSKRSKADPQPGMRKLAAQIIEEWNHQENVAEN